MTNTDTATQLLDTAQLLIQKRGYNAFSYKHLATTVGIRTASIHYHFQTKADLGKALMDRYLAELEQALDNIDRKGRTNKAKLKKFIGLYRETEDDGVVCLCGSLATDYETLPVALQRAVSTYLGRCEQWVAEKIDEGVGEGEFALSGSCTDAAATLVASLQGGLILSRARGGPPVLDNVQRTFLAALNAS